MKKSKMIFIGLTIIVCLILCFIIMKLISDGKDKQDCEYSNFEDIIFEINSTTNSVFSQSKDLTLYIPGSFTEDIEYLFAINNEEEIEEEYFIIIKNISDKNLNELKNTLSLINTEEKKLVIKQSNFYTYVISSKYNYSSIDGIIRSFSSCY